MELYLSQQCTRYSVCFVTFAHTAAVVQCILGFGFEKKKSCREVSKKKKKSRSSAEPLMRKVRSVCKLRCENRLKIPIVFQQLVKSCFKHQWNRGLSFCVCPSHLLREVTWASEGLSVKQRKQASMRGEWKPQACFRLRWLAYSAVCQGKKKVTIPI